MALTESVATYNEGESDQLAAVMEDEQDPAQPIAYTDLNWAKLTLTDARTGAIVNGRDAQNVKNANDVQIHPTNGSFLWDIQPADVHPLDSEMPWAEHKAHFTWSYNQDNEVRLGEHLHRMRIRNFTQLCTVVDVKQFFPNLGKNDEYLADWLIDVVSAIWEGRTARKMRTSVSPNPTVAIYSPGPNQHSLPIERYPVSSILDVVEEPYGNWGSGTILDSTVYTVLQGGNYCRLVCRDGFFTPGYNSTRVRFYGGYARDTGQVESDLRFMAARQAAFWLQRRDQLGISSVSAPGFTSAVQRFEKDLLKEVESCFAGYATIWL